MEHPVPVGRMSAELHGSVMTIGGIVIKADHPYVEN
jgi:hypothetical protein